MKKIYLDSCILIAYFSKDEKSRKKEVEKILDSFSKLEDYQICVSSWTISEMMNILLSNKKLKNSYVLKCESTLLNKRRIGETKIIIVNIEGENNSYDLSEFIFDVRENILKYHSGVGDIIHSVIMKNNEIEQILTYDEKEDFKKIAGLTVLHPSTMEIN